MGNSKNKRRLLLIGGSSLLSWMWSKQVNKQFTIYITKHRRDVCYMKYPFIELNLNSSKDIANKLNDYCIDIVVNTIGLTSVEACEEDPIRAFNVHKTIAGKIAKACRLSNSKLIHISTDHFFKDEKRLHSENDNVTLLNMYAKSKYEGEEAVLENHSKALICRTNFFGLGPSHRNSFSECIIKSISKKNNLVLFDDVYITPVNGKTLAKISHILLDNACSGIYNISSDDSITKYSFGLLLCKIYNLSTNCIEAGSIHERNDLIRRPTSMALSNDKCRNFIKESIGDIEYQMKLDLNP